MLLIIRWIFQSYNDTLIDLINAILNKITIANSEGQQRLIQLEDAAKAANKGKWNQEDCAKHVRDIVWNLENPRHFVDSFHNKPVDAVVEHVRDGCTVRVFILPSFHYVTLMMSGIKVRHNTGLCIMLNTACMTLSESFRILLSSFVI